MSLINVPLLLTLFIIPESPRWLIGKGRFEEAKTILIKGAKINNLDVPKHWNFTKNKTEEKAPTTISLFKTPYLRMYTLGMYILWFGHGFVYYGIGLNIGNIGGNLFVNFTIFGLVDVPAFILCAIVMAKFNRKV
jgi:OCT family organic cation transporter-like MFS transporter 4/5